MAQQMVERIREAEARAEETLRGAQRQAAQRLAEVTGGELFEIQPEVPYTAADLNWRDAQSRSTREMKDPQCRPSMAKQPDLQDVDVVFVGFPVWWYTAPSIVRTFLESADFSGNKGALFGSHYAYSYP